MHASDYAPTLTELQDKIDRLAAENKAMKQLCKIYFEIAERYISESQIRKIRDDIIKQQALKEQK